MRPSLSCNDSVIDGCITRNVLKQSSWTSWSLNRGLLLPLYFRNRTALMFVFSTYTEYECVDRVLLETIRSLDERHILSTSVHLTQNAP